MLQQNFIDNDDVANRVSTFLSTKPVLQPWLQTGVVGIFGTNAQRLLLNGFYENNHCKTIIFWKLELYSPCFNHHNTVSYIFILITSHQSLRGLAPFLSTTPVKSRLGFVRYLRRAVLIWEVTDNLWWMWLLIKEYHRGTL